MAKIRRLYRKACSLSVYIFFAVNQAAQPPVNIRSEAAAITKKKTMSLSVFFGGGAVVLGALAGLFGIIGWFISWQDGNAKDKASGKLAEDNKERFTALENARLGLAIELNNTKIQLAATERQLAPRRLTGEDKVFLVKLLSPIPKEGVALVTEYDFEDGEALDFSRDIQSVLRESGVPLTRGWTYRRSFDLMKSDEVNFGKTSDRNLGVEFQRKFPTPPTPTPNWVEAFAWGLKQRGYILRDGPRNSRCREDMIIIEVGKKPPFPER